MADTAHFEPVPTAAELPVLPSSRTARRHRRQRRPTGAPPPLPRSVGNSGLIWLAGLVVVFVATVVGLKVPALLRMGDRIDTWLLQRLADIRTPWLTHVMRAIKASLSGWADTILGLGLIVALMILRRWRHLLVFVGCAFVQHQVGAIMYELVHRPRPYGVTIIGGWGGFAMPSPPVATLALILIGIAYTLFPHGRPRNVAKVVIVGVIVLFGLSRAYLAVDHPSDILFGAIAVVAIGIAGFRLLTPNEIFPVVYRRGTTAHLDITGRRGEAIRSAVSDQLGLDVLEIKPFGLEGSGGSTPLRLKVEGDPTTFVFAKLYAKSHVRADRWYKLWRTILYGALEDEASFQTVRRFVEYEDYTLRLLTAAGVPTAESFGIVEITPGSEYLLVMGFFDGAREIGEAEVDDDLIDQGLGLIRRLWDAGLAHRDIKPANLLVKDGRLLLIDAFFVQVRPSPWRQAVDLANMMLVLAVRSDPDRVYRRALAFFSPEEIAEAFAATRGVASPTQLRAFMKRDGRDLMARFRALAPHRRPIAIQRWSVRRVVTAFTLLGIFALATATLSEGFLPVQNPDVILAPECGTGRTMILVAQSVPSSSLLPCVATLPSGWRFAGAIVNSGRALYRFDSDRAGPRSAVVTLTRSCDRSGAEQVPSDEAGTLRFERPIRLRPGFQDTRFYEFPGGCVTYDFAFAPGTPSALVFDVDAALTFEPRSQVIRFVRQDEGERLCGVEVPCPGS
jgi:membrane-associated phospholipid phosphatase